MQIPHIIVLVVAIIGFLFAILIAQKIYAKYLPPRFRKRWVVFAANIPFFLIFSYVLFFFADFVAVKLSGSPGMYDVELLMFMGAGLISSVVCSFISHKQMNAPKEMTD